MDYASGLLDGDVMTEPTKKIEQNLDLALIGNSSVAALIDRHA